MASYSCRIKSCSFCLAFVVAPGGSWTRLCCLWGSLYFCSHSLALGSRWYKTYNMGYAWIFGSYNWNGYNHVCTKQYMIEKAGSSG